MTGCAIEFSLRQRVGVLNEEQAVIRGAPRDGGGMKMWRFQTGVSSETQYWIGMVLSRNVLLAFFFGLLVGNLRPVQKIFSALPSIRRVNRFLIGMTYPPVCEDQYVDYPVGKPMSLDEMGENFSPIPGAFGCEQGAAHG